MDIGETFQAPTRKEWRAWLAANYDKATQIWLVNYHKDSGKPTVSYNDAVEEALCFGWIDGQVKSRDHESSAQRYTPRRDGSSYSQINKERLAWLIEHDLVIPPVLEKVKNERAEDFAIPDDIIAALKAEPEAWEFFSGTSPAYQRIRAAYVDSYRDLPEEFDKRIASLVKKSAARKQFGYGIEKYY
jgi:uncharacterized protein YdeI (YjbR/CyaY-like superfamily)